MNRKTGVLLSYVLMIFEVLSTLLLTPYIIRTLGQAEYGVYKLAASINAYLLLLDLGVGNAVTRYIAKYRVNNDIEQERKFLGVATLFYLFIALISILVGSILIIIFPHAFAKGLTQEEIVLGQKLLSITMINTAVTLGTTAYNNVIVAYERFDISKGVSIVQIVIRIVITFVVLKSGMGSVGIVSVNLFLTVIFRSYFVIFVVQKLKIRPVFRNIKLEFLKEVFSYSSLILLQMIATQLNATVDQILIGSLATEASIILAVYGVGVQIVQYYQSIGSAFNGVLMPGVVKLVEKEGTAESYEKEMIRVSRIIFLVTALIWGVFLVNGQEFIILWAGEVNSEAYYVSLILMSAYMFVLTEAIGSQILWAMNKHKEQAILKFVIVIANVFLTVLLIKWRPLLGATIGTFISIILGDVLAMNVIFKKKMGIRLTVFYRGLLKGIITSLLIMICFGFLLRIFMSTSWLMFIIKSLAMIMVYVFCLFAFGLNKYERGLFISLFKSFSRKIKPH